MKEIKRLGPLFGFFLLFGSCLDMGSTAVPKKKVETPYTPKAAPVYQGDFNGREGIEFRLSLSELFPELDVASHNFILANAPRWLKVNSEQTALLSTPFAQGLYENIRLIAQTDTGEKVAEKKFSIGINGDPLRRFAWHLDYVGYSFPARATVSNSSINAQAVFNRGITGKGARVAVSDTGVQVMHEDLIENALSGEHKDYSIPEPYYGTPTASHFHGTAVASIIAAKGWNNVGSTGVAPDASFAGFQFLDAPQTASVLIDQASGDFDIFNYSYGDYTVYDVHSNRFYLDQLRYKARSGRGGRGSFFVKAAGNEFFSYNGQVKCTSHNANAPLENESPFMIVVGAINAKGERASYSNAGSNLWVSAPGGEGSSRGPAIIAADLPSCFSGVSKVGATRNNFEYGHPLNKDCNYTSLMNGTSSAAPVVSGVIALILEANPDLDWRQVRYILAKSARKVDPESKAVGELKHPSQYWGNAYCDVKSYVLEEHEYELGWVKNKAGFEFHNWYGFGMVDADEAVRWALEEVIPEFPELVETNPYLNLIASGYSVVNNPVISIPDASATGLESELEVTASGELEADFVVESVQVRVKATHPRSGELGVELTSPSGTKSILLNINNSFLEEYCSQSGQCSVDEDLDIVLTSNAFYLESGIGKWTLKVIDGMSGNVGSLDSWRINLVGHNP